MRTQLLLHQVTLRNPLHTSCKQTMQTHYAPTTAVPGVSLPAIASCHGINSTETAPMAANPAAVHD